VATAISGSNVLHRPRASQAPNLARGEIAGATANQVAVFDLRLGTYMDQGAVQLAGLPAHPVRVRKRVGLPGQGPRALAVVGSQLYVANYFTDDLCRLELTAASPVAELLRLGTPGQPSLARQGEMLFNDAQLCFQGWQSCASCHDTDGRTDALNWDLLNDGTGNPKNTRSLLWASQTPPAMTLGVRTNAGAAIRAGLRHILFADPPAKVPAALEAYLQSLQPVPSPYLVNGRLSPGAQRGKAIFHQAEDRFDTPTLVELWRTAPYLHDSRAADIRAVLVKHNPEDRHGKTSHLSAQEVDDLAEYLLSL
jgi:cytochrome c peroxidase